MRGVLPAALFVLCAVPVAAQTASKTVHAPMIWGAAFGDQRVARGTSLYWDLHARRADGGAVWQINLGSVGVTRDLPNRWRATAALGWSHGYRYGEFAARTNSIELRPWLQLTGARPVGSWTWSDRSRAEFRVLRASGEFAPPDADWAPTVVRLRRQDRFDHRITADRRWYAAVSQEFLVNVHPARSRVAMLEQLRTQGLIGHQLTPKNRLEVGYGLQRINRRGGFEMNHTLLMYFRTFVPIR